MNWDKGLIILWAATLVAFILMVIVTLSDWHKSHAADNDFMQFVTANHCYIFEYDQHPDGTIQKRWSCQNDTSNQDDPNSDEE